MKPLFIKKNGTVSKVSGIIMNLIPSYTLAEYNALTHKPLFWVRTDEDYAQIPSTDVSYGSGSVKDALDGVNDQLESLVIAVNGENVSGTFYYTKIGRIVMGCGHMTCTQAISAYGVLVSNLPAPFGKMPWNGAAVLDDNKYNRYYVDYVNTSGGMGVVKSRDALTSGQTIRLSVCYMANDL